MLTRTITSIYDYDAFGNLQEIIGSPGRATPTDSATNRLEAPSTYSAAGNLTSWNGNLYEYDAFHMMTRMIAGSENYLYVYTADDERIWQFRMGGTSPGHSYTLRDLSGQVLREYSSIGDFWTIERDYVYRSGQLLAAETPAGRRHFHLDHLGTPRLITAPNGSRLAYHVYFPFGEEATDPLQDQERMKFTGYERDLANPSGTGDDLDYMHARFCSPVTGRFTSVDPISENARVPQSWNRFSYARGNPLRLVDPSGMTVVLTDLNSADESAEDFQIFVEALRESGASQNEIDALTLEEVDGEIRLSTGGTDFSNSSNPDGYPTGVTGYASITFQPNDLYATITHTNGVVVTQAADPNGMARPASITASQVDPFAVVGV